MIKKSLILIIDIESNSLLSNAPKIDKHIPVFKFG